MKNWIYILVGLLSTNLNAQIINDESHLDLDFFKFKNELLNSVLEKDTTKLKSLLAESVFESNDGCGYPGCTKEAFIEMYFKYQTDDTWSDLLKIIRYGFQKIEAEDTNVGVPHEKIIFQGPSYKRKVDEENEVLILGANVNIREKPSLNAKIIQTVSYEKFKCDCSTLTIKVSTYQKVDGIDWLEIKLENGNYGYVNADLTSYNLIKELTVGKVDGEWKIVSFYNSPGC
jgi:hypothetical protein